MCLVKRTCEKDQTGSECLWLLPSFTIRRLFTPIPHQAPENDYALGPLDMFPADIAAAVDWCNLLFGCWWSWLEKWGKLVSIILRLYYLYVVGCWLLTTLFSLRVLYQEHGFGPNFLWGLGPGQDVFPMRFYRQWRCFKQHFSRHET